MTHPQQPDNAASRNVATIARLEQSERLRTTAIERAIDRLARHLSEVEDQSTRNH